MDTLQLCFPCIKCGVVETEYSNGHFVRLVYIAMPDFEDSMTQLNVHVQPDEVHKNTPAL